MINHPTVKWCKWNSYTDTSHDIYFIFLFNTGARGNQVRRPVWHLWCHRPLQLQQSEWHAQGRQVRLQCDTFGSVFL